MPISQRRPAWTNPPSRQSPSSTSQMQHGHSSARSGRESSHPFGPAPHHRPYRLDWQDDKGYDRAMEISCRNYTNGSAPFLRGYQPGDVLIAGWAGTVSLDESLDVFAAAERVFV